MFSRETEHYGLPQYQSSDFPSILGDINGAFKKIDDTMYDLSQQGSGSAEAVTQLQEDVAELKTKVEALETLTTSLNTTVTSLNTTVNDPTGGLVKQMSILTNAVTDLERRVSILEH